ncbi:CaiB/BaiF CoA-transferase family protein [Roseomonas sp. AR75]|uniref:CaiB/BaiF CoA transferase family protein n=1 Tax=Roseomonas sp. AR75 TaxID=2562311 RepID=UPI0010C0267A|nr:CoA transferase [Roseomonas sp. AR75]
MTASLDGLRLLDLSTVVAGPFATELLGHLGMDVIRIQPPPAEPPWPEKPPGAPVTEAEGFTWSLARNKRSICLDLKSAAGRAVFLDLVRQSDIVYENFRPGVMQRLRLDHATLAAVNPRIVSVAISGFGSSGPWAEVGAYDVAVQALGGSMSITGTGEPGSIPCRWGVPVGDIAGSLYAAIGLMAALEERAVTGRGQAVEVALLDAQLALNTYRVPQAFGAGATFDTPSPRRGGAGAVPYGPFRCGDGAWLVIAVASNFWPAFRAVMALPEDPRFATLALRQANQAALDAQLEHLFLARSAAAWEEALVARGVPAGRVNDIADAFAQPQAEARGMRVALDAPGGRQVFVAGDPIRFAGEAPLPQRAPVPKGADTDAVLGALPGYDAARIAALREAGAVA